MSRLQIDNPFFTRMGKLGDLVLLNLVWLACCLPVVTIGAATAALFRVTRKMAADEDYRAVPDFLRAFREGWKTATAAWLILLLTGAVSLADLLIGAQTAGTPGGAFLAIGAALCVLWLAAAGMSLLLLARYRYTARQAIADGLLLSAANPQVTLAVFALAAWMPLLFWKNPEAFFYILPPWLLIGGALSALCLTALMLPVYAKIEAHREKEDHGDIEAEARL